MLIKQLTGGTVGGSITYTAFDQTISGGTHVDCGFKPKYIMLTGYFASSVRTLIYDETVADDKYYQFNGNTTATQYTFTDNYAGLSGVDSTGFTLKSNTSISHGYLIAVG